MKKDVFVEWIPSIVELIGVIVTQIHYIVCIMARAGDIGGKKADSWGLDFFFCSYRYNTNDKTFYKVIIGVFFVIDAAVTNSLLLQRGDWKDGIEDRRLTICDQ
jgi:hypothetical protein